GGRDSAWSGAKASARLPALTLAGTWPAGGEGLGRETNRFDADQGLVRRLIKTADPAPPPLQEAHDRRAPKSLLTCGKVCAQYAKLVQSPLLKTDPSASRTPDDPRIPGFGQSCC